MPVTENERELLRALKAQHGIVDSLLAALIVANPKFMPTKSSEWPACVQAAELLKRYEWM